MGSVCPEFSGFGVGKNKFIEAGAQLKHVVAELAGAGDGLVDWISMQLAPPAPLATTRHQCLRFLRIEVSCELPA